MVNALARKKLEEARRTHSQRVEARLKDRVALRHHKESLEADEEEEEEETYGAEDNTRGEDARRTLGGRGTSRVRNRKGANRRGPAFFGGFFFGSSPTGDLFSRGSALMRRLLGMRPSAVYPDDRANNLGDDDPGGGFSSDSPGSSGRSRRGSSDSPRRLFVGQKNHRRWLRRFARRVVDDPDFDALVVLVVLANCISLALFRPTEPHDSGWNLALERTELALNGFFTIELALRVARGGFDEYWADPWNRFDALLVAGGYGGVIARAFQESGGGDGSSGGDSHGPSNDAGVGGLRALRALRALRPLRAITRFESLRSVVACFIEAVPLLVSVVGLVVLFVFVFALAGQTLFQEAYHLRCANPSTGRFETDGDEFGCAERGAIDFDRFGWGGEDAEADASGTRSDDPIDGSRRSPATYGSFGRSCPDRDPTTGGALRCARVASGRGTAVAGYDNVGLGMLTVFQCTTLAGWAQVMYRVMDSGAVLAVPYFVSLVFFGPYFVVTLFLAVLKTKFGKAQSLFNLARDKNNKREDAFDRERKAADHASNRHRSRSSTPARLLAYLARAIDESMARRAANAARREEQLAKALGEAIEEAEAREAAKEAEAAKEEEAARTRAGTGEGAEGAEGASDSGSGSGAAKTFGASGTSGVSSSPSLWSDALERRRRWAAFRERCRDAAEHPRFNAFFLFLVALNAVVLAIEHHGMDADLERALTATNVALTALFAVEVGVKLVGVGAWAYFADGFNRFDFFIVFFALVELLALACVEGSGGLGGSSGGSSGSSSDGGSGSTSSPALGALSALKVFRTFRVFKMFRYLGSLRVIGEVMLSSLGSFVSIAALLGLFLVVFAIVGLHVFGGLRDPDAFAYGRDDPQFGGRANFDSFYHSVLTTFQVLTLEDWEFIAFGAIEYAGWGAFAFFIAWVIVGKYTLLTLFLAVTMEAFESKYDERASAEARLVARFVRNKRQRRKKRFADMRRKKRKDEKKAAEKEKESQRRVGAAAAAGEHTSAAAGPAPLPPPNVGGASYDDESFDSSGDSAPGSGLSSGAMTPSAYGGFSGLSSGAMTPSWGPAGASPFDGFGDAFEANGGGGGFTGGAAGTSGEGTAGPDSPSTLTHNPGALSLTHSSSFAAAAMRRGAYAAGHALGALSRQGARPDKARDLAHRSWFCVPPHHPWRERCHDVVNHPWFDRFMFLLIFASCACMTLERPGLDPGSASTLRSVDYGLAACFATECALKTFVLGFKKYLSAAVNRLDFVIVLANAAEIALASAGGLGAVRSLRILRAIRPLRALTKSSGMRLVLQSVVLSVGAMVNVSVVILIFFVIFGILGVQVFAGRFFRCTDPSVASREACVGTFFADPAGTFFADGNDIHDAATPGYGASDQNAAAQEGGAQAAHPQNSASFHQSSSFLARREWVNAYLNFDNLYRALVSLFVTATLDGYGGLMFDALDATGVDRQPRMDANPGAFLFFLAFIVLCAFTLLNLYVGVIFYQFSRIRTLSQTSSIDLTEEQKEWAEMCKVALRLRPLRRPREPPRTEPWFRWYAFRVATHRRFENAILACVALNVAFLASAHRDEPEYWRAFRDQANVFFAGVFVAEAAIKIHAFRFKEYWRDPWNRFDLFVAAAATADAVVGAVLVGGSDAGGAGFAPWYAKALRLFRVARVFRLVKRARGLKALFATLLASLPAFSNVGAFVMLLFFIYAYVGVVLFGSAPRGDALNEHANFESFQTAFLTLVRVATNDEWVGLMRDCADASVFAYPFFVSFVVAVGVIMLNLFTAVIIENFENTQDRERWKLSPNALDDYAEAFHKFDDGSGTIRGVDLESLLRATPAPLGLGIESQGGGPGAAREGQKGEKKWGRVSGSGGVSGSRFPHNGLNKTLTVHFIKSLNVPLTPDGRVPFKRAAFELVRRVCECDMPPGEMRDRIERGVRRAFPDIFQGPIPDELSWSALMCVLRVQRHWRELKRNRALREERERRKREEEEQGGLGGAGSQGRGATFATRVARRVSGGAQSLRNSLFGKGGRKASQAGNGVVEQGDVAHRGVM